MLVNHLLRQIFVQLPLAQNQQVEVVATAFEPPADMNQPLKPLARNQAADADHQELALRNIIHRLVLPAADCLLIQYIIGDMDALRQAEFRGKRFLYVLRHTVDAVKPLIARLLMPHGAEQAILLGVRLHVDVHPRVLFRVLIGGVRENFCRECLHEGDFQIRVTLEEPAVQPFRRDDVLHDAAEDFLRPGVLHAQRRAVMHLRRQHPGAGIVVEKRHERHVVAVFGEAVDCFHQHPLRAAPAQAVNQEHYFALFAIHHARFPPISSM